MYIISDGYYNICAVPSYIKRSAELRARRLTHLKNKYHQTILDTIYPILNPKRAKYPT